MEFIGKIIEVLPAREGTAKSTGNQWKAQSYVIESNDTYPRKMCFDVFGADKIEQFKIQMGEEMTVSFDIDAHEYQGRWYNSIRAWKVDRNPAAATAPQGSEPISAPAPAPAPQVPFGTNANSSTDDLPF